MYIIIIIIIIVVVVVFILKHKFPEILNKVRSNSHSEESIHLIFIRKINF